ncbi:helix-turn-helix domain-containing protein [Comamonas composti]|uniref:helix-turn-helix domain-containing protein n=1 Tax=Comamonas composti TaxID=408558 RepID=UPI00047B8FA9|nr:helix-turn-helix domain-containing protein [Comamonas composti]
MPHIGERIRKRRAELALTQGRLAEAAGITPSAVSQIESGAIRTLKSDTLSRVALALQTTALELTAGLAGDNAPLPVDEQRILEAYRALPEPLKDVALRLLKALK